MDVEGGQIYSFKKDIAKHHEHFGSVPNHCMNQERPDGLIDHTFNQLIEAIRLMNLLCLEPQQEIPQGNIDDDY